MFKNYKDCLLNNKIILQSQQRFKSDHHNVYTEQINKIALSSNDDKRLQTFDKITTYPYETNAFRVCESKFKGKSFKKDVDVNKNKTKRNLKQLYIPDYPYRILIRGGSGSGKTNVLLNNLMNKQPDFDKIHLYAQDSYEAKYQILINKSESIGLKHFNDTKAFIEYSNGMKNVYENISEYNPCKNRKILIVFDDMIADIINNEKLNSIVTALFIRGRKLNISLVFITQSYFIVPKGVRLNSTNFFIMKIPNKI